MATTKQTKQSTKPSGNKASTKNVKSEKSGGESSKNEVNNCCKK